MAFPPMLSLIAATRFITLILYSFFKEIGLEVDAESMVNITPSHTSISKIISDAAAYALAVARFKTCKVPISYSMDTGNKGGKHFMVKKAASWHHPTDSLFLFAVDSDVCEGTNERAAKGVDVSLIKLDHPNHSVKLINVTTDAGGGRVYVGLKSELVKLERMDNESSCHSCGIHGLNLTFVNPITKFCGVGGVKHQNSLQLIFTYWAIEQEFELGTWQNMWLSINNNTYSRRQVQPVLTRWKYVGESCNQFIQRIDGFKNIAEFALKKKVNMFKKKVIDIATDLLEMIVQPELITMCFFIDGLYCSF